MLVSSSPRAGVSTIGDLRAIPYLAYTLGTVPAASRIRIGVEGLCFFMVG